MNKEQTLAILKDLGPAQDKFSVISEWVLELRAEYEKTIGYPYLESVKDWIIKTHNLSLTEIENKNLNTLVYNASNEGRRRNDLADGFLPLTEERLESLLSKPCQYRSEGIFGNSLIQGKVVKTNGRYAFLPKGKRTRGYWIDQNSKIKEVA